MFYDCGENRDSLERASCDDQREDTEATTKTNDIHDVAAVQMALKKAKHVKAGCQWYKGPIDGKISHALTNAIIEFKMEHCIRETGKIDPISPTRTAINKALNANWCGIRGLVGTTCLYVPGPYPGFNALTETKKKAPFPDDEVTGLVRLMANIQKEFDLTLTCSNDNITNDGRFATTLAINYDQFVDNSTATLLPMGKVTNAACNIIHKYVKPISGWNEGSADDLNFTSKRQLQSLKNTNQPSAAYLKKIGASMPTNTCAKKLIHGTENIDNISITINEKNEFVHIKQALDQVDKQTSSKIKLKEDRKLEQLWHPDKLENSHYQRIEDAISYFMPRLKARVEQLKKRDQGIMALFHKYFKDPKDHHVEHVINKLVRVQPYFTNATRSRFLSSVHFGPKTGRDHDTEFGEDAVALYYGGIVYIYIDRFFNQSTIFQYETILHEGLHHVLDVHPKGKDETYKHKGIVRMAVTEAIYNADSYVALIFENVSKIKNKE